MPGSKTPENTGSSGDSLATSRSLLLRARQRDDEAWELLVGLYAPLVQLWCRRGHVAEQDMPDVTQEVFRAVLTGIESFRKERPGDTFRGWLCTVTRNKVNDHFRRQGRSPPAAGGTAANCRLEQIAAEAGDATDSEDETDSEERLAEQSLLIRGLQGIRDQFEPRTWEAFWRVTVQQQPVADVALELGMQSGAVRVAKCRVLQRLRQQLGEVE